MSRATEQVVPARDVVVDHAPDGAPSRALLLLGVFGAPAAWSVDALAAFFLHQSYCAGRVDPTLVTFGGVGIWLSLVGLITTSCAVWSGVTAWRSVRLLGRDTGRNGTRLDRRRFMAQFGLVVSGLFLFGILMRWSTILFVSPLICTMGS